MRDDENLRYHVENILESLETYDLKFLLTKIITLER